jgi:uncharacterized protein YdaU (DUF1376 family)
VKLSWMPLDIPDYRADTAHLGALEHGIYILLIMHYWQTGSLPDDDKLLARIACATPTEWRGARPVIEAFFLPGWKHKRIELELQKARSISGKRSFAADEKHALAPPPEYASAYANAQNVHHTLTSNPSPSQSESKIISIGDAKREARPPKHCATTSKAGGRVYVVKGTSEWDSYAADFREATGQEPNVNSSGGRWFKTQGEQRPQPYQHGSRET